jgi:tRNA(fMet)-specific endonuclease VapC
MLRYLLDSNLLIEVLRYRPAKLRMKFNQEAAALATSSVVASELVFGALVSARPVENRAEVDQLLSRLAVLNFDRAAAEHAADIRAQLQKKGKSIGAYDALIAGHARSLGLELVTANLREFARVPGLRITAWL